MKKVILLSALSALAVGSTLAAALAFNKKNSFVATKATEKTFRFDSSSSIPGISGQTLTLGPGSTRHQAIHFTGYSGYSTGNAIECDAFLSNDINKVDFCTEGYFMKYATSIPQSCQSHQK